MQAAIDDNKSICELLIENGADIDIQDKSGQTAIMLAAEKGHLLTCQFLIENGV
jgi:ankyrin repeat protein